MDLVQARMVTEDVEQLAGFYADLLGTSVPVNEFYVEVPTGAMSVGFSRCRFTEEHVGSGCGPNRTARAGEVILDFTADDVDREHRRLDRLGVTWVMGPTDQPWGARAMMLRDPEGHLVNVFCRQEVTR
jgi:uncharacterized glyoxalase superfamily protein PhnB